MQEKWTKSTQSIHVLFATVCPTTASAADSVLFLALSVQMAIQRAESPETFLEQEGDITA